MAIGICTADLQATCHSNSLCFAAFSSVSHGYQMLRQLGNNAFPCSVIIWRDVCMAGFLLDKAVVQLHKDKARVAYVAKMSSHFERCQRIIAGGACMRVWLGHKWAEPQRVKALRTQGLSSQHKVITEAGGPCHSSATSELLRDESNMHYRLGSVLVRVGWW